MSKKQFSILFLLWAAIYIWSCRYPPALLDDADTVHAEAAREMVQTGDWITLHANGIRYLEKAPLMYWSVAVSYKLFGVNEFATRLPIALATLALCWSAFLFGKRAYNQKTGFYAALILMTSAGIFLFTRVLWPDIILTLFITLIFYFYWRGSESEESRSSFLWMYVFSALAILTKGLIGAVFPGLIILLHLILTRRLGLLKEMKILPGILIFLVIAAPWHIAAGLKNKGFFWFYFINEHFLRYIGKRYPVDYDTVPLGLFLGLHLLWLFPWTFFLPFTFRESASRIMERGHTARSEVVRKSSPASETPALHTHFFILIWAAVIILFFCFSTRQEYYTMPAYPAIALWIAAGLTRAESDLRERPLRKSQLALAALGIVIFAASITALILTRQTVIHGDISTALNRNPQAYALSLGHILDLTPASLAALRAPILGTGLTFLLGTVAAWIFRRRNMHWLSNVALAATMALFFQFAHNALVTFEPYLSSKKLAESLEPVYKDGEIVVINGEYENGSSINYYLRRPVYILNGRSANLEYGSYFPDAPKIFLQDADFVRLWNGDKRIYLMTDESKLQNFHKMLQDPVYRISESGGKAIISNRP